MISNFNDYIAESYLKGGRQPLYHYTRYFDQVIQHDTLKVSTPTYGDDCICFTRSLYYETHASNYRFVLDSELLKRDGYKVLPHDEIGTAYAENGGFNNEFRKRYTKSNPFIDGKFVVNNVGIVEPTEDKYGGVEWEYEERLHKNITNLGKYLIAIDVTDRGLNSNPKLIKEYLVKYPHIEIISLDSKKLYDRRNIIDFDKFYLEYSKHTNVDIGQFYKKETHN